MGIKAIMKPESDLCYRRVHIRVPHVLWRALKDASYEVRRKGCYASATDLVVDAVIEKLARDFPRSLMVEDDVVWVQYHRYVWPKNHGDIPVVPVSDVNPEATISSELGVEVDEHAMLEEIGLGIRNGKMELWRLAVDWRQSKAGSLVITSARKPGRSFATVRIVAMETKQLPRVRKELSRDGRKP